MNSFFWTLSWVLLFGGALLIGAAAIQRMYREEKEHFKGTATGTVVDIIADVPPDEDIAARVHDYYYPVIAYYAEGRLYKERGRRGGNPCPYVLNQEIAIKYDLHHPDKFRIAGRKKSTRRADLLRLIGLLCCITGGILFLLYAMRVFPKE